MTFDFAGRWRAGVDHLGEAAALGLHQHVGQQQRERLVADELARAPHRVAEAERQLLAGEARLPGARQIARQELEVGLALALGQRQLELELAVEVILDHRLVAAGDEDEMLDAGLARLVDHVLDQRAVDHRQHFLGHRLGGREEPRAEAGDGKDRFADGLHVAEGFRVFVGSREVAPQAGSKNRNNHGDRGCPGGNAAFPPGSHTQC